jgi:chromosomal replication initiation ATPase DnaA
MDKVEKAICKYFNVNSMSLVDKDTSNNVSMARSFLFYILNNDYGFSLNKIMDNYCRTQRSVCYNLSKIKCQIKMQKVYRNIYNEIMDMLY